jgi:Carboxypeptidase regulatory-like domain
LQLIRSCFRLSAFVGILSCVGAAYAQETTSGSIAGTAVDTQGAAMPGATVTITSPQGTKTYHTDTNGRFFAPYLTPGDYSVRVELTGFSPVEQKNIAVRLGQRVSLDFTMKVGQISETVEVVGAAPTVDTTTTTIGGVLDSDTLNKLPVGRAFTDTLYLLPGVSDSSYAGSANPSIGGASGLENNFIIDGVNASNAGFGAIGSYSRNHGSLGSGVTSDFIKETQVKTGGYEA